MTNKNIIKKDKKENKENKKNDKCNSCKKNIKIQSMTICNKCMIQIINGC